MPKMVRYVGRNRCFNELRWAILCLSLRGGPVTEKRLVRYGRIFKVDCDFVKRVIRKAISEGIVKYVPSKDSYVLVPPPRKSVQQKHPSNGQDT